MSDTHCIELYNYSIQVATALPEVCAKIGAARKIDIFFGIFISIIRFAGLPAVALREGWRP